MEEGNVARGRPDRWTCIDMRFKVHGSLVLARRSEEERAVRPIYIEGGTRNGSRRHEGRQQ